MANLNINIPDNLFSELSNIASQLKQTPEQCLLLSLNHFLKTDTVENAIEGIARAEDSASLVEFPEFKEEVGIDLQLHPLAMDELETLELEDQMEVLGELIERISGVEKEDEEATTTLDLDLKDQSNGQLKLAGFSFGDIVYQLGQNITIYHIALLEDDIDDEDFADEEDDSDDEDDFLIEDEMNEEEEEEKFV